MYNYLLIRWIDGKLTASQVDYAVTKGWITAEEAETIKATPQNGV